MWRWWQVVDILWLWVNFNFYECDFIADYGAFVCAYSAAVVFGVVTGVL